MADIVLRHLNKSRSMRILWMLEELELEYEVKKYERNKAFRAPPELKAVHPLGKSPVVAIDGVVYAESGAIVEALIDHAGGKLRPEPGTDEYRRYRFFLHYAEGSVMPPLLVALIIGRLRTAPVPFFLKPVIRGLADRVDGAYTNGELDLHLGFVQSELSQRDWFASDELTGADVQMLYPMEGLAARAGSSAEYQKLQAFLDRVHERPAYKRALERGGPFSLT